MGFPITSYQANVPQLDAEVDRVKAKAQGVPLTDLFDTLQIYLGSAYVNDFNLFGRTWQVYRAGRRPVPRRRRGHRQPAHAQRARRDGADRLDGDDPARPTAPIRCCATTAIRPPTCIGEADPRMLSSAQAMSRIAELAGAGAAERHELRVDAT